MKQPNPNMNAIEARRQDRDFYADQENDTWYVFGDNSGFAYSEHSSSEEAEQEAQRKRDLGDFR